MRAVRIINKQLVVPLGPVAVSSLESVIGGDFGVKLNLVEKLNDLILYNKLDRRIVNLLVDEFRKQVGIRYLEKELDEKKRFQIYLRNEKVMGRGGGAEGSYLH